MNPTAAPLAPQWPTVRRISADDAYAALAAGWADFRAAPRYGLFFGGVYAVVGIAIFLQLWVLHQSLWIVPFAFAFPLVGPFAAIGLYEVSRRREAGEPLDARAILGVVWQARTRQIPMMAFVVLAGFLIWMWAAGMLTLLFLGHSTAGPADLDSLLASGGGHALLVVGGLVGAAIAATLFALTVVSLPLLLDRDLDVVTAMATSVQAVMTNPQAMLHWAWIVVGVLAVAMVPLFLGVVVGLPVLGHATWHLYRRVIAPA
ncbi:MAG: DUF2189 domain-containing protein [Amaricoccus sp.]|uniref:DUF2189 domain-containing protein n=1 Tax=Amaricoccus sp. TaxID=1872485 RepID=UPI0039E30DA8